MAGTGDDTVLARDGVADTIDCGPGQDRAEADPADRLEACEVVVLDRDGDRVGSDVDCQDGDPSIRPGAPEVPDDGIDQDCNGADGVNLDRDGDGFVRPLDCDDTNPGVRPRAPEVPGNKVDENCDGRTDPFPFITSGLRHEWENGKRTRVLLLTLRDLPPGSTVRVSCRGGGCPPRAIRPIRVKRKRTLALARLFAGRRLRPGATITVVVTKAGYVGKAVRFRVRRGKTPTVKVLCVRPGGTRPRSCG